MAISLETALNALNQQIRQQEKYAGAPKGRNGVKKQQEAQDQLDILKKQRDEIVAALEKKKTGDTR